MMSVSPEQIRRNWQIIGRFCKSPGLGVPCASEKVYYDLMNEVTDTDNERMRITRNEIVERTARAVPTDGPVEKFPGFTLNRVSQPTESLNKVYEPAFCFIAQ